MDFEKKRGSSNSLKKANLCSNISLSWVIPLILKGAKGNLKPTDIRYCPKEHSSERIGTILQEEWERECRGHQPSLFRAFVRSFGLQFLWIALLSVLDKCVVSILQSILLGYIIEEFANVKDLFDTRLYTSVVGACLMTVLYALNNQSILIVLDSLDINLYISFYSLIYKKALKLSLAAMEKTNVGQMINFLSNDMNKFQCFIFRLPYLIVGPIQTVLVTAVLRMWIGYASLVGVSVLILYTPLLIVIGKLFSRFSMKTAVHTDERLRLTNEIINGMRVIKMYGWELLFSKLIDKSRKKEVKTIRYSVFLRSIQLALYFVSSKVILLVSFAIFAVSIHGDLTPEKVFVCFTLTNYLRQTMGVYFPLAIASYAETAVFFERIQEFLHLEERQTIPTFSIDGHKSKESQCSISMHDVTASWNKESEPTLRNITLSVKSGELLAILGPVGCGKTSLLMSLLNELPSTSGKIEIRGSVAYASQEPWIFSGNLKQNIVLGRHFDERKYKTVLTVCALKKDIEDLPNGDETAVGERGVNLSRGQKCRVSLARAIYFDSDIILLDDPLSAVDSAVSKHLFEMFVNNI